MSDKALLVGINNYRSISNLKGCLNDLDRIGDLLQGSYGFSDDQIRRLRDTEATKTEIVEFFRWLLADTSDGDRVIFHFSGHGSYVPGGPDEQLDEIICLHDMDFDDPSSFLRDDEIGDLASRVPPALRRLAASGAA